MTKPSDAPSGLFSSQIFFHRYFSPGSIRFSRFFLGIVFASALFLLIAIIVTAKGDFTLDSAVLDAAEKKYGPEARANLLAWQQLVRNDNSTADIQRLESVNTFFNTFTFVSDVIHWSQKDYWATPIEFLASDGGDCEDFALAKYFTLKLLGVAEEKLHLTYVKALNLDQSHMVLTYYENPERCRWSSTT